MAEQLQPDYDLVRQLAFLKAGGKLPGTSDGEQFQKGLSTVASLGQNYNTIISQVLANKKASLDQQAVGKAFGIATPAQATGQQSTYVQPNIFPQAPAAGPLTQEGMAPQAPTQNPGPAPIAPMVQQRQDFKNYTGVSPDMPTYQAEKFIPEMTKLNILKNAKMLYANPNDFTDISVAPDALHTYAISQKEGLNLGTKNPTVGAYTGEGALQAANDGKLKAKDKVISPMQQGMSPYADMKDRQFLLSSLPSRAGTGTLPAQASAVQLAARQLKTLIATPGSYQRLGLAKGDVARMVLRAAPQQEVLKDAGFSDTLINSLNVIKQKISSDPTAIDQPLIRKELYDIGTELEKSSRPVLERSLNETERSYGGKLPSEWTKTRAEELGDNFPDIPFQGMDTSQIMYANNGVQRIQSTDGGQTWSPVK